MSTLQAQTLQEQSEIYDNSMLSAYKDCPRKYYLRYRLHWRSSGTAMPLVFGLSWHAGQDVVWQHAKRVDDKLHLAKLALARFLEVWQEEGLNPDPTLEDAERWGARTPQNAHEMYVNYIEQRWAMLRTAELLAVEQPFAVPVPKMEGVWYVGRLDKVVRCEGQQLVLEHKTTSDYKIDGGFRSSYVDSWYSDSQVKGYQFGGGLYYPGLTTVWVDAALVHKKVHDKFRFIPVSHHMQMLEEWQIDLRDWISRVQADNSRGYYPKNENNCMGKYGPCSFLNICRTTPDNMIPKDVPEGYTVEEWKPFDILQLNKLVQNGG